MTPSRRICWRRPAGSVPWGERPGRSLPGRGWFRAIISGVSLLKGRLDLERLLKLLETLPGGHHGTDGPPGPGAGGGRLFGLFHRRTASGSWRPSWIPVSGLPSTGPGWYWFPSGSFFHETFQAADSHADSAAGGDGKCHDGRALAPIPRGHGARRPGSGHGRPRRGWPEARNRSLQTGSPPPSQCLSCRRAPSPSRPGGLQGAAPACRVPFGNRHEYRIESRSRKREGQQGPEPSRCDHRPERRGKGKAARNRSGSDGPGLFRTQVFRLAGRRNLGSEGLLWLQSRRRGFLHARGDPAGEGEPGMPARIRAHPRTSVCRQKSSLPVRPSTRPMRNVFAGRRSGCGSLHDGSRRSTPQPCARPIALWM